jgi:hypothetical protein
MTEFKEDFWKDIWAKEGEMPPEKSTLSLDFSLFPIEDKLITCLKGLIEESSSARYCEISP